MTKQTASPFLFFKKKKKGFIWFSFNMYGTYKASSIYASSRHLGSKSELEIIKDTGHAANFDSPDTVNALIKSFVLDSYPSIET